MGLGGVHAADADYFRNDVLDKRPYIRLEWCVEALKTPLRREVQAEDGRSPLAICTVNSGAIYAWSRWPMA